MSERAWRERVRVAWPSEMTAREAVLVDTDVRGAGRHATVWMLAALGATLAWSIPFSVFGDIPRSSVMR